QAREISARMHDQSPRAARDNREGPFGGAFGASFGNLREIRSVGIVNAAQHLARRTEPGGGGHRRSQGPEHLSRPTLRRKAPRPTLRSRELRKAILRRSPQIGVAAE